ncbi:MAG: acylglycerol kinase family protein, partial [Alphaproteobacteria bacterium]|nr:acylglycerol kinase family protein [Alphaproteobacteria bacterium]
MSAFSETEKDKKSPTNSRTALVIFNPVAGRRRRVFFRKTLAAMEKLGLSVEMQETEYPGHAEELARERTAQHAESRPDLIVAAGGDGTINEVANGMIGSDVTLGIIPLGTANVLAKEIGLPQR